MITFPFTWTHRYQGLAVAEIEGTAYIELLGDDWFFSRITFSDIGGRHEVDVLPADRKAIETFLCLDSGWRDDIECAVLDAQRGRTYAHRETAAALRAGA